jgi:3-phosphoshikimate 1-carboxyvinyltransferase
MTITVHRSKVQGTVQAPPSKSETQRLLAAALLAKGTSIIRYPSRSDDALAAMGIIRVLGARIEDHGNYLTVKGGFDPAGQKLDCGEAGLSIRMFAPIAALADQTMILTGSGSLQKRPVSMVAEALNQLGVRCQTQDGFLPLWIKGPMKSGRIRIDGSISSQLLTGMLMALPVVKGESVIEVHDLQSKPYIDLTLQVLKKFGIKADNQDYKEFHIPGKQKFKPSDCAVEGDWSGAAFLLVAGALGGTVTVKNLSGDSLQGDRQILTALGRAGAIIELGNGEVTVSKNNLQAFDFDATQCPDLFPPLVALAAHCEGTTRITGTHRLIHKESNRSKVLQEEFYKIGVTIRLEGDTMYITGPSMMKTGDIDPHGDHRIAMAAATIAMCSRTPVRVADPGCVAKSYPGFYDDLKSIGGRIDE